MLCISGKLNETHIGWEKIRENGENPFFQTREKYGRDNRLKQKKKKVELIEFLFDGVVFFHSSYAITRFIIISPCFH